MKGESSEAFNIIVLILWSGIIMLIVAWVVLYLKKKKQRSSKEYPFLKTLPQKQVSGSVQFYYELPRTMKIHLYLNPADGRVIDLVDEVKEAGAHTQDLDTTELADGNYYYGLESEGFKSERMLIIKN